VITYAYKCMDCDTIVKLSDKKYFLNVYCDECEAE
jgi:DNA-directed RNA polymerase subunit RPC12/RpoP